MTGTTLCINDGSVIPMNTRLERAWLTGPPQYDTGVNASVSNSPGHSRWSRSSIQAQIPEDGESSDPPSDFNEYDSGPVDERLDLEAASGEEGPDDLDDPWPYTFQVRKE
jgi:hypothetical protein